MRTLRLRGLLIFLLAAGLRCGGDQVASTTSETSLSLTEPSSRTASPDLDMEAVRQALKIDDEGRKPLTSIVDSEITRLLPRTPQPDLLPPPDRPNAPGAVPLDAKFDELRELIRQGGSP